MQFHLHRIAGNLVLETTISTLKPELQSAVQRELESDEEIRWISQPNPKHPMKIYWRFAAFLLAVNIAAAYFIYTLFKPLSDLRGSDEFPIPPFFAAYMIFIALLLVALIPLFLHYMMANTVYVLTNKRALLLQSAITGRQVRSFEPKALSNMTRKERRDGSGDLVFAQELAQDSEGHSHYKPVGFRHITNVRRVEQLVRDVVRG